MIRQNLIPLLIATLTGLVLASCSSGDSAPASGLATMPVTLPNGDVIRCEVALNVLDQSRGLMFRESLADDTGMLFVFMEQAPRAFWMFRTKIPLDIIWMDSNHEIVEISANAPPCPAELRDDCPKYGGTAPSMFVVELAAGQAAARGLKIGDRLRF